MALLPNLPIPGLNFGTAYQKTAPIALILFGAGIPMFAAFAVPGIGIIRPQSIRVTREGKGTVYHTDRSAYLDDFGQGAATLLVNGHTGFNQHLLSGLPSFKLMEAIFVEFLERRARLRDQNRDPNLTQLWWIDTLMAEAFSVYPMQFTGDKTAGKPLFYFYGFHFVVIRDLLQEAVYQAIDFLSGPALGAISEAVEPIVDGFAGLFG